MDSIEKRVLDFVASERAEDVSSLTLETTLFGDLALYGDDCDVFFTEFAGAFDVDLEGFDVSVHFPPEPYIGPSLLKTMLRRIFISSDAHEVRQVVPLRIADLVQWVQTGRAPRSHGT